MHVQCLAISAGAADSDGHDDKLVSADKVPDAALFGCGFVAWMCLDVEFEAGCEGQRRSQKKLEGQHRACGWRSALLLVAFLGLDVVLRLKEVVLSWNRTSDPCPNCFSPQLSMNTSATYMYFNSLPSRIVVSC